MSNTITLTNTLSTYGGVIETGAGLPITQIYQIGAGNTLTTSASSQDEIIIENPLEQTVGAENFDNQITYDGISNADFIDSDAEGQSSTGGTPPAASGGSSGSGNNQASTCADGDPGTKPPGTYVAAIGLGTAQVIEDSELVFLDIGQIFFDIAFGAAEAAIGSACAKASATATAVNADANALVATVTVQQNDHLDGLQVAAAGLAIVTLLVAFAAEVAPLSAIIAFLGVEAESFDIANLIAGLSLLFEDSVNLGNQLNKTISDTEKLAALKNAQEESQSNSHSSGANKGGASDCAGRHDPIVIDLTGNGLNITDLSNSTTYFDFNGNGFSVNTAWIGAGTGFLILKSSDSDYGVSIGDGYELLGTGNATGFAILKSLITNSAGTISSSDSIYSQLAIWQDVDGNGLAQASEISSLADIGIASISLNATAVNENVGLSNITDISSVL